MNAKLTGPESCELLVIEAAKDLGDRPSMNSEKDKAKLERHLSDMLLAAEAKIGHKFIATPGNELLGIFFMPGASFQLYGFSHRGYVSFMYPIGRKYHMPSNRRGIGSFLEILKIAAKVKIHLNNVVGRCYQLDEQDESSQGTAFACLPPGIFLS